MKIWNDFIFIGCTFSINKIKRKTHLFSLYFSDIYYLFINLFSHFFDCFLFLSIFIQHIDSELEELETTPRYRPDSLSALSRSTRFSEAEIKRIYRGFKAECPTGVVKEDTFKIIYSQFFPQGGLYAYFQQ